MPISSFHGLRRNSVPAKPWNSTKTSPQRTIPRDSLVRKRSLGVPRLWEHNFQVVDELQDDAKCHKNSHSSFGLQKSGKTTFSLNLKSRNERQSKEIKRRDTFPRFEISSPRTSEKVLKRSKTDSSIIIPKKKTVRKFKDTDNKSPKRPSSLWIKGKREERSPSKFRKRKLGSAISPLSSSFSNGSVEKNALRQGDRIVCILNKQPQLGILKYLGRTHFADGEWCGILLENPCGKNDGSVRGVRYFRCRNKHGVFVHSHKVKRADEVDLSTLNLTEGYSSPESSGNPVNTAVNTVSTMASSEVSVVVANQMICKHWDMKSQRLSRRKYRRNRSISLDRYLFLTTKHVTKGLNVFSQNTAKCDSADLWQKNCINRSVSLPRICQEKHAKDSNEFCLAGELEPLEMKPLQEANGSVLSKAGTQLGPESHSHSHSEALETLFRKSKASAAHSKLGYKGSWPSVSRAKQSLRGYGSSDDIDPTEMVSKSDPSNKRPSSAVTSAKPISSVGGGKHHPNLENFSSDADTNSVNQAVMLLQMEAKDQTVDADSINTESLSGSQTSLSSTGTSNSKGKKISTKKQIPSSAKGSISKPKAMSFSGVTPAKVKQKQSKLEQIRQQQQKNCRSSVSSSLQKPSSANKTSVVAESSKNVKLAKRHTLAGISDVKSSVLRPTISKRVTSDGIPLATTASSNDDAKSRLPVKKQYSSMVSQAVALPKGKVSDKSMSVERKNSSSASRVTVKRNSSLAGSDSKPLKQSTVAKVSNIAVPSRTSGTTLPSSKGPKGVTAAKPKSQTSQVAKPSSSTKVIPGPVKDSRSQPSSISTKKIPQVAKQNVKNHPTNIKQGTSKLPRKMSAQLSNASDSASVTSSVKDQLDDNLEDFRDTESNSGSMSPVKPDLSKRVSSEVHFAQDETDARVSSPFEMSCRIMPPDLLSQTPYLSKHSIGIQVDDDSDDSKTTLSLKEKVQHLNEILKQRTDFCGRLQNQLDKDSKDFISVSIMILSVVSEMQVNNKYCSQLERKIQSVKQEMNVVQEKLAEEEANSVKLQEEMMYQRSEHTVAIETLKADYENLLERTSSELKNKHEGEIALAIETHKLQVKEMHQQHENEIFKVKKSHEELVASLKDQHRDEIVDLESKHSSAFDELVEEHQVEIEIIKADYDEQQTDFKEKYEKMVNEWNSLNKKFQQVQDQNQKDIETRLQEEVKKYESLPDELESIKAVLEMKNEEIRQLRKEKMEKHLELEHLVDIKEKTKKLQQENESLSFVVETKSKFERQLSVERDTLRNSLERESAKSKRLSLENEELQWRLVNSTSPPSTPTGEERPLPAMSNRNSFRLSASFPDPEVIDE
ncbi:microtubule-associated tumor suppressor 1-like isoform X2 [Acropora muricata]|uniref:microtubule-associated tumor suppressor 1-like isoform X2 n=1 Tax=Acropora muricata TaxID=159855 RepID=UPI0034E599A1